MDKREKQRITNTQRKHGSDAFRRWGKKGGRPRKGR